MKKVLLVLVTVALLTSCGKSLRSAGGEVTGVRSVAFNEPAPYGMVWLKEVRSRWVPPTRIPCGESCRRRRVSFDAFWMDQTEVTNAKYRQFVYYVRDSIIRERWRTRLMEATICSRSRKTVTGSLSLRIWTGTVRFLGDGRTRMSNVR